jgi:hypothetical protein
MSGKMMDHLITWTNPVLLKFGKNEYLITQIWWIEIIDVQEKN